MYAWLNLVVFGSTSHRTFHEITISSELVAGFVTKSRNTSAVTDVRFPNNVRHVRPAGGVVECSLRYNQVGPRPVNKPDVEVNVPNDCQNWAQIGERLPGMGRSREGCPMAAPTASQREAMLLEVPIDLGGPWPPATPIIHEAGSRLPGCR